MNKTNVLVFPAGAENALEIFDALNDHIDVEVFGASTRQDYASLLYEPNHYIVGPYNIMQPDFLERFNSLLEQWEIDIIIPTHDEIAYFLAKNSASISGKLLLSPVETARVCREKRLMYQALSKYDFCPAFWVSVEDLQAGDFPIFAKPNIGAGAHGTRLIENVTQFQEFIKQSEKDSYVFCEYLPGIECTVDCYTDRNGQLLFSGARIRERVQNGISVRATTFPMTDEINEICKAVNESLRFFGAWYLQLKKDANGQWKLLEISCRQAGGMTLYRHKGINFPLMGIYELNGIPVSAMELPGVWSFERRLSARYQLPYSFDTVYVDLDDTLIVKDKVNTTLIAFLYQCLNEKKDIILITRHSVIPADTLQKHKIPLDLFHQVIHLSFNEKKVDYINEGAAIFIDNSFVERNQVYSLKHIPSFDVNAVDCLLNFRKTIAD